MKSHYVNSAMLGLAMLATTIAPAARASEWDRKTIVNFSAPVQIQNTLVDAGQHVFKLLNTATQREVVQVFNADETKLETIVIANYVSCLQPTSTPEFTFYESASGDTVTLHAWFYPGESSGLEFSVPKPRAGSPTELTRQLPGVAKRSHAQGE